MDTSEWFVYFLDHTAVMKQVYLWSILLVLIPAGIIMCRASKAVSYVVFIVMVMSLADLDKMGMTFFTRLGYRAPVIGINVYLTDICAWVLGGAMLIGYGGRRIVWRPPLLLPMLGLILVAFLSWTQTPAEVPVPGVRRIAIMTAIPPPFPYFETGVYPLFEIFRLTTSMIIFWVTANFLRSRERMTVFLVAVALAAIYVTYAGLYDRYILGFHRVSAGLFHPNDFGHFSAMLGAVLCPLIFYINRTRLGVIVGIIVTGVVVCTILSVSRSALAAIGLAGVIATFWGWYIRPNLTTYCYIALGVIAVLTVVMIGKDTLTDRFLRGVSIEGSVDDRMLMNIQATAMGIDHPLGVGMGNFSAYSWHEYAERVDEEGVLEPGISAHNIWFLTFGELGILGVLALAAVWIGAVRIAMKGWRASDADWDRMIILGLALAFMTIHVGSLVHFSYRNVAIHQLMHVFLGALVGMYLMIRSRQLSLRGIEKI